MFAVNSCNRICFYNYNDALLLYHASLYMIFWILFFFRPILITNGPDGSITFTLFSFYSTYCWSLLTSDVYGNKVDFLSQIFPDSLNKSLELQHINNPICNLQYNIQICNTKFPWFLRTHICK